MYIVLQNIFRLSIPYSLSFIYIGNKALQYNLKESLSGILGLSGEKHVHNPQFKRRSLLLTLIKQFTRFKVTIHRL